MKALIASTFIALAVLSGVAGAQANERDDAVMVGNIVHPGGITGGH